LKRAAKRVTVPTLLMLAGQERVIDNGGTKRLLGHFAEPDTTIIEYASAHHTLEFEPQGHSLVADMADWLARFG
jgi:alpha-beta hydrolase superfamily lysophospholipase